jgi:hypothetical protein
MHHPANRAVSIVGREDRLSVRSPISHTSDKGAFWRLDHNATGSDAWLSVPEKDNFQMKNYR